jgi:3-deoxy-manno-octulosonate cytidylyltransferase (CMP-KDO synthetase)
VLVFNSEPKTQNPEPGIIMDRKIVAVVPARYDSTRYEGKPLAVIAGKTMIERVYLQAKKVKDIDRVIVAVDDERIEKEVKRFGGEVCLTSKDHASGTDRIAEVIKKIDLAPEDIVVNIQGDEPLLEPKSVEELVNPLMSNPEEYMSTLCYIIRDKKEIFDPNIVKTAIDKDGYALYFSRSTIPWVVDEDEREDLSRIKYYKHLGLYAYRKDFLLKFTSWPVSPLEKLEKLEQLRVLENGYRIKIALTEHDPVEVDRPEDVKKVERIIKDRASQKSFRP